MKISYNWLKDYTNITLAPEQLGEILTNTGLEVEGMEDFESVRGALEGIVVGEVVECVCFFFTPHPVGSSPLEVSQR